MGDAKVEIEAVKYRINELAGNSVEVYYKDDSSLVNYNNVDEDVAVKTAVNNILAYTKPLPDNEAEYVAYPATRQGTEIYKWFGLNRGRVVSKPTIVQTLPKLGECKFLER